MSDLPDWYNVGDSSGTAAPEATVVSAAPPARPTTPLPDWYNDGSDQMRASLKAGAEIPPDHAAQVLKLSDQTGLPTNLVTRNVDSLQKRQVADTVVPGDFHKNHPIVAGWLGEDPHHAAVAGSDIPILGFLERQFGYMTNQAERGAFDVERSYLGMKAFLGIPGPDDERRRQQIEKRLEFDLNKPAPGPISKVFGSVVEATPQLAGIMGLTAAAGVAAGGLGASAATAGAFGAMEAGNAYLDYRNKKDGQGNPISEDEARGWATVSGVLNGAAALIPVGKMMEMVPGLKMLGREGVSSILANPTARAAFQSYIKGIGESSLAMGGFSGFQTLVHRAAGDLASMHSDNSLHTATPMAILSKMFSQENLQAAAESAESGAVTGAVIGGGLGGFGLYKDYGRAKEAQDTAASWKNIGTVLQDNEMLKRAPDQVEKVVSRLTPDQHVYIPLDQWQTYWQGKQVDPRAVYKEIAGTTSGYDDAMRTGIDLQIPASRYAVTIAPSEHNEFFSNFLRSEPLALNADEAQKSIELRNEMEGTDQQARDAIGKAIVPEGERDAGAGPQDRPGQQPTEQAPQDLPGKSPASAGPDRSVFPGPTDPSLRSITAHPDYFKMTQEATDIVKRYAGQRGIEPTFEFANDLWHEMHDALGDVRNGAPEKRAQIAKEVMAKYPDLERAFVVLKDKLWSDKAEPYFQRNMIGKYVPPDTAKPEQQAVTEARRQQGMDPLFPDPKAVGMSDDKASRYSHAIRTARAEAQEDVARKIIDRQLKEKGQAWNDERATVQTSVEKESWAHPGFLAKEVLGKPIQTKEAAEQMQRRETETYAIERQEFDQWREILKAGIKPDPDVVGEYKQIPTWMKNREGRGYDEVSQEAREKGLLGPNEDIFVKLRELRRPSKPLSAEDHVPAIVKELNPLKLKRTAVTNDYPEVDQSKLKGMFSDDVGVHPDTAAEILGFKSGDELLHELQTTPNRSDWVQEETDRRMLERHPVAGGMFGTASNLPDQAMDAVHNEQRSRVLRLELEHLASNDFATFKGLIRAIGRRIPTIQEVRTEAEDMIGSKTTAETLPSLYQRAEATASREAQEHFLRGDFEKAFEAKKQELLNHELYRAAQNAKEQIGKDIDYVAKFERDSVRSRIGKAGSDYLEQIDAIRERFDFGRSTLKDVADRKSLRDFVEAQRKAGYEPGIPAELLNEAYKTSWKSMSNDQLHSLIDSMRSIDHLSGLKTKLLASAAGRDYQEVKDSVVGALKENFKLDPLQASQPLDLHPDLKTRVSGKLASFAAWRTKMEFLFRFMDGGNYHGPIWETFFKPMNEAENFKTSRMSQAVDSMNEVFKDYSKGDRAKFYSRLTHVPEIKMSMNKMDMMMTALHWGNEGNRTELLRGYNWNESQVRAIWKNLDARDFQTVQKIWSFIDSFWPEISKQERDLNGLVPEKIQASPFDVTLKDGSTVHLEGGYFPLVYDKNMSWRTAALGEDAMVKDLFATQGGRAATKRGWTNERIGGGGQAPSLSMGTFVNHVSDVIHDLAYRKPVIDLYKLINDQDIRQSVEATAGKELYKQLNPWLKRIAGDRPWNPLGPLEALSSVRSGMTSAELGLKFTSAFIHASSFITASRELGPKYTMTALKDSADIRGAWDFAKGKSEFMRSRPDNFDRDVRSAGKDLNIAGVSPGLLSEIKAYSPIKRTAFWSIMRGVDMGIAIPTWMGAYRKAMEGSVKNIEAGNEPEAVDYADQLVRDTKGSGAAKDLAPIQTAGGELGKLFTMFYTQLNVIDNQFMEAYREVKQDKNIPKLLTTAAMTWFLPAAMTELLRGHTPSEDEGWGKWLAKSVLMYPMAMIPGLREATSFWQRGDLQASPVFEAIKTMLKTSKNVAQEIPGLKELAGEKDEWTDKDYHDAIMTVGYTTGLPTRQAIKTATYLHDWMTGAEQPANPVEGLWRTMVGRKTE